VEQLDVFRSDRAITRASFAEQIGLARFSSRRWEAPREMLGVPFDRIIGMHREIFDLVGYHENSWMLSKQALQPRAAAFGRAQDYEVRIAEIGLRGAS
jgi:hypothetical protein